MLIFQAYRRRMITASADSRRRSSFPGSHLVRTSKVPSESAGVAGARTAATTLLRFGREGIELDDLAARVEALEDVAVRAA